MIFLIVLYKTNIFESQTIISLLECFSCLKKTVQPPLTVFIWDNSPLPQNSSDVECLEKKFAEKAEFIYFHCEDNFPLSKVYNHVIDRYVSTLSYLTLLDQDSTFSSHYFERLFPVCISMKYDLVLPMIKHKKTIVSPSLAYGLWGRYINDIRPGDIYAKHLSAINSGMSISLGFIERHSFRYDECLKNYCTDDCFMQMFRLKKGNAFVLNYVFEHDLSLSTLNSNSDVLRTRYKDLLNGWRVLYGKGKAHKIFLELYILVHKVKMAIKYRDVRYLVG